MPEKKRWNVKAFEQWTGLPWQPRGQATPLPGTSPGTPVPTTPGRGKRGVYITVGQQIKHGPTPNCPGCHCSDDNPKPHNKECRARFEEIVRREKRLRQPESKMLKWVRVAPPQNKREAPLWVREAAPKQVGGTADQDQAGGTADQNLRSQSRGTAGQAVGGTAARPEAGGTA